jgi:hypothetical protein
VTIRTPEEEEEVEEEEWANLKKIRSQKKTDK